MALINCPECGKEVSEKAENCINCGYPIKKNVGSKKLIEYNESAVKYIKSKDYAQAEVLLKNALEIDKNHKIVNFNLGYLYMQKDNSWRNIDRAIQHLQVAGRNGHANGYIYLGIIFNPKAEDFGKKKDANLAGQYYLEAAKMGNAEAMNSLGVLFGDVKKDYMSGATFCWLAYKNGYSKGLDNYRILSKSLNNKQKQDIETLKEFNDIYKKAENRPKCPSCHSVNIKRITGLSKAGSVAVWGIFAAGRVSKQWHCNNCGTEW